MADVEGFWHAWGYSSSSGNNPQICWLTAEGEEVWISPDPKQIDALDLKALRQAFGLTNARTHENYEALQGLMQNVAFTRGQQWTTWDVETPQRNANGTNLHTRIR